MILTYRGDFLPGIPPLWEQVTVKSVLGIPENEAVLVAVCTHMDS